MGLDCPGVCPILHWGPSNDIKSYIQETGRCGRDGFTSNAVVFYFKTDERFLSPKMVDYCKWQCVVKFCFLIWWLYNGEAWFPLSLWTEVCLQRILYIVVWLLVHFSHIYSTNLTLLLIMFSILFVKQLQKFLNRLSCKRFPLFDIQFWLIFALYFLNQWQLIHEHVPNWSASHQ